MNYTRALLVLISSFSSLQSSQFYFSHVIKQLKAGSFQSDCNRALHLAGPNKIVKDTIIQGLVSQSQCTLFRIDIAQIVATLDPSLLHSYFQQIRSSSEGVLLCIDNIEVLSLSSTYRNITDALWTECLACLESCQNVLIIFTAVKCTDLHPQFRFTCRCIKHPTLLQLPPLVPAPPTAGSLIPHEPIPSTPTQTPSIIVTPSRHRTVIKGLTAASVIGGLWWLNREDPPVRTPQLPPIAVEEPQIVPIVALEPQCRWRERIRPFIPRILTTITLLADEVSRWTIQTVHQNTERMSTHDYNALPQPLRNALSENHVTLCEIPNSNRPPHALGPHIVIGSTYNPLDERPLNDELLREFRLSKYFLIAHQLAHIEFNDITHVLPVRMLITCGVPFALHAYDRISRRIFNAALNRLDPEGRMHSVIQKVKSIHSKIVCNPVTQTFVTLALKAAYHRNIEFRAHTRALELNEIKTHKNCNIINSTLQRSAVRRAKAERTWIEIIHYWLNAIPLFNPHSNSIPIPPPTEIELEQIRG